MNKPHIDILLLCPMKGNGGIASWTKKFLASFPDEQYTIYPVNIAPDKEFSKFSGLDRVYYGIRSFLRIQHDAKRIINKNPQIRLMHITSAGGYGVARDYQMAKMMLRHGIKSILHCRFGNIPEMLEDKSWIGRYFKKSLDTFDQVWVLDKRSVERLRQNPLWHDKVFLTPNSIEVPTECNLQPKNYKRVGFVGNIVPTKGIFELTEAVVSLDNETQLFIAGQGLGHDVARIKSIAGKKLGKNIHLLGILPNTEAVKLIETLDIICLPTYYGGEAFPISILEAMSYGKLVISCPRAAIPDMLTSVNGTKSGILVPDHDVAAIANAIKWCQEHPSEADTMCRNAYEKVNRYYKKEIVYEIYRKNYQVLLK